MHIYDASNKPNLLKTTLYRFLSANYGAEHQTTRAIWTNAASDSVSKSKPNRIEQAVNYQNYKQYTMQKHKNLDNILEFHKYKAYSRLSKFIGNV